MIGEIIETSSLAFVAESTTLHRPPPLGELVKVNVGGASYCFGVVCYGSTSSPDSGRRAVRRGTDGVVDEAIYDVHPQLTRLLQTIFQVALVAWQDEDERIRTGLPPSPPPMHHAVHLVSDTELRLISDHPAYLTLLHAAQTPTPPEQLLAAHLRVVARRRGDDNDWLERATRDCLRLLKADHRQLLALLSAVEPR